LAERVDFQNRRLNRLIPDIARRIDIVSLAYRTAEAIQPSELLAWQRNGKLVMRRPTGYAPFSTLAAAYGVRFNPNERSAPCGAMLVMGGLEVKP
jgi:hypothetical protein